MDLNKLKFYINQKKEAEIYLNSFKGYIMSLIRQARKKYYIYNKNTNEDNMNDLDRVININSTSTILDINIINNELEVHIETDDFDWEDNLIEEEFTYYIPLSAIKDEISFNLWFINKMKNEKLRYQKRNDAEDMQEYLRLKKKFGK
ncbi:MAG: hypothetical protein IJ880_16410 [Bacilli bacterium]|nr:hypothetical protein [Bacilli bacterium]